MSELLVIAYKDFCGLAAQPLSPPPLSHHLCDKNVQLCFLPTCTVILSSSFTLFVTLWTVVL